MVKIHHYKNRFLDFYQRHRVLVTVCFFISGFLVDVLTVGRIDDLLNLIQQAVYLGILGTLLLCEIKIKTGRLILSEKWQKFWRYHDLFVHFLFGSLLSVYIIFYYTSASAITSFLFIVLLAGLMMANEFPRFKQLGIPVRVILFSICLMSYFLFFYPILMGHVGQLPFWLGFLTSLFSLFLIWIFNFSHESSKSLVKRHVLLPALSVHLFFLIGYYTSLIPPVPVAVKKIGVYYSVEKVNGKYIGTHLNPFWKIWTKGSQDFRSRPGDKVVVLLSIFSPARFNDQVFLKWYLNGELQDTIPMTILGGRNEGFRGFGTKSNYQPGDWRVIVETSDGREVGRINFSITQDNSVDPRVFYQDIY